MFSHELYGSVQRQFGTLFVVVGLIFGVGEAVSRRIHVELETWLPAHGLLELVRVFRCREPDNVIQLAEVRLQRDVYGADVTAVAARDAVERGGGGELPHKGGGRDRQRPAHTVACHADLKTENVLSDTH